MYDVLSSFRLYYIQFKENNVFYGCRGPGAGGQITQTPVNELLLISYDRV